MGTSTRYAISLSAALALLVGCGEPQPQIGAPGAIPLAQPIAKGASSPYKVLHRFTREDDADGYYPVAPLIEVNGTFYGTTEFGGSTTSACAGSNPGCGTVFSVSPSGVEHVLYAFTGGSDGGYPLAALTDVNGTLYGTTSSGGSSKHGVVFSMSTSGAEHVLYNFAGGSDGSGPGANLIYADGLLYGTTRGGGVCTSTSRGCGTVFTVSTGGKERVIYRFMGGANDGAAPWSGLIEVNGTFYGTTYLGGDILNCNCGTVYSVTKGGKETMLLRAANLGAGPTGGLLDVDGTMYGTMSGSIPGFSEAPTVYSITPQGKAKMLYQFNFRAGTGPVSGLTAVKGTLYGTTEYGGSDCPRWPKRECGIVYSVTTSGAFQVVHNFTGGRDGALPQAALLDVKGTLYGTTSCTNDRVPSNVKGVGTIFALTP